MINTTKLIKLVPCAWKVYIKRTFIGEIYPIIYPKNCGNNKFMLMYKHKSLYFKSQKDLMKCLKEGEYAK